MSANPGTTVTLLAAALLAVLAIAGAAWRQRRRAAALAAEHAAQLRTLTAALADAEGRAAAARVDADAARLVTREFLANMSHELRTPIHGALGMLELTLDTELTADQRDALLTARASLNSLRGLVGNLLDAAAIRAGRLDVAPEIFALRPALREAVDRHADSARARGLDVTLTLSPDLPQYIEHDRRRVVEGLAQLVDNAIRFTEQGAVTATASVAAGENGSPQLLIEVRDTGSGVPEDLRSTIFEPFRQADNSTTRVVGGAGLGLSIVAAAMREMGGRIELAESVSASPPGARGRAREGAALPFEGTGSLFRIVLPLNAARADAPVIASTPHGTDARARVLRILVAEDNPVNQRVVRAMLTREGHTVDVVPDGREAVDACARTDYDLVLMDLQMPVMGGLEATRAIREWERSVGGRVPIVVLTARTRAGDRDAALAAGANAFLTKPAPAERVFATIRAVTGRPVTFTPASTPAVREADDVFDESALLRTVNDDRPLLGELCTLFLRDAPGQVDAMRHALARGDLSAVAAAAHALKGSAATLTASRVAVAARAVETLSARGDWPGVANAIKELEPRMVELTSRLRPLAGAANQ